MSHLNAFVYLMESQGLYKVGMSKDPKSRLLSISGSNPCQVTIVSAFESPNAKSDERFIHSYLEPYRLPNKREWFAIPPCLINRLPEWFYSNASLATTELQREEAKADAEFLAHIKQCKALLAIPGLANRLCPDSSAEEIEKLLAICARDVAIYEAMVEDGICFSEGLE